MASGGRASWAIRVAVKFVRYVFVFAIVPVTVFLIRYEFLSPDEKNHFRNFIVRVLDSSLAALSKTRLGFVMENIVFVVVGGLFLFIGLRIFSRREEWREHLKNSFLAIAVGLTVSTLTLGSTFAWKTVTAICDDHQNTVARWREVVREKDRLKAAQQDRDRYIARLESTSNPQRIAHAPGIELREQIDWIGGSDTAEVVGGDHVPINIPLPGYSVLFLISIRNAGPPTMLENWGLHVIWPDGKEQVFWPWIDPPFNKGELVITVLGRGFTFPKTSYLLTKSIKAIPAGDLIRGFLYYPFPKPITPDKLKAAKKAWIVSLDVTGAEHKLYIKWERNGLPDYPVFPGLIEQ